MLRKDFFLAEMERLSQVLARIIGLKEQGQPDESKKLLQETLNKDFDLNVDHITGLSEERFQSVIIEKKYPAQKLDILARLLFEESQSSEEMTQTISTFKKILLIFNFLEKEHHTQSLENINKRSMIEKFLKEITNE